MSMTPSKLQLTLTQAGFGNVEKLADTLQGSVWRSHAKNLIIKCADKALAAKSTVILDGAEYRGHENILKEISMLKYLASHKHCPRSLVHYKGSFQSDSHLFCVMEYGGDTLLNFTQRAHAALEANQMSHAEWHRVVRVIVKQTIEAVSFLHSLRVCHMDISLENILIDGDGQWMQCKLCDFGLAELFPSDSFESSKFCGKVEYQCPEMVRREEFDARAADVWCIAVCLFMMIVGTAPWQCASECDAQFKRVMDGEMKAVLKDWERESYVDDALLALMRGVFRRSEAKRITLKEMRKSAWIRGCT